MFTGDEILDAWTPDGRPAGKQPRRVIGALGLSTTPPMPAPALPADIIAPSTGPAQGIGGPPAMGGVAPSAPTNLQALSAQDMARISSPAPAVDAGAPPPPSANQASPAGAGEPSPPTKPPPQDVTTAQLRQAGIAGAYNREQGAIEDQATAAQGTAQAEADALIKKAQAEEARNAEVTKILADRSRAANEQLKVVEAKQQALGAARDKWANTKIDRSIDHPVLAAISVALGALGSAMSGRKDGGNPALDALMASIDRKVAGQMQDLDKAGKALGMQKEEIAEMRQLATDKVANYNLMISAETERAARQIEALTSRSNSDIMKAKGTELAAGIRARGAEAFSQAVGKQLETDFRQEQFKQQQLEAKQANAARWAGMAQADRHFNEQMKFNREKLVADENAAIGAARAQGDAARAKELSDLEKLNRETGINDVASGTPMLQPEGQKMLDEATKLEEQASKTRAGNAFNPQAQVRAKMMEDRAAQLRGEATLRHQFRARDTGEAKEISKLVTDTQSALEQIDDIKALYKTHGKAWIGTSEGEKAMRSKNAILALTIKDAYQLGALDKGSAEYLDKITGGDPSKIDANVITGMIGNSAAPDGSLDALAGSLEARAQNRLKTVGYRGAWKPTRKVEAKPNAAEEAGAQVLSAKTSAERLAANEPGLIRKAAEASIPVVGNMLQSKREGEDAAASADSSLKYFGFPKSADKQLDNLFAMHAKGGAAAKQAQPVLIGMALDSRPAIRVGAMRALREHAPDLYQQALSRLPASERAEIQKLSAGAASISDELRQRIGR